MLRLEYEALRKEIIQSISYQHQILLAGYGAAGAFVSYVAYKLSPALGTGTSEVTISLSPATLILKSPDGQHAVSSTSLCLLALAVLPIILYGMAALWIVECNRMVMASFYIKAILWPCMQAESKQTSQYSLLPSADWEGWIRSKDEDSVPKDIRDTDAKRYLEKCYKSGSGFRARQHRSQSVIILVVPIFLSVAAFVSAFYGANLLTLHWVRIALEIMVFSAIVGWLVILIDFCQISDLGCVSTVDAPPLKNICKKQPSKVV